MVVVVAPLEGLREHEEPQREAVGEAAGTSADEAAGELVHEAAGTSVGMGGAAGVDDQIALEEGLDEREGQYVQV